MWKAGIYWAHVEDRYIVGACGGPVYIRGMWRTGNDCVLNWVLRGFNCAKLLNSIAIYGGN